MSIYYLVGFSAPCQYQCVFYSKTFLGQLSVQISAVNKWHCQLSELFEQIFTDLNVGTSAPAYQNGSVHGTPLMICTLLKVK